MKNGRIKWFNPEKGYGFITPDEPSQDVFFNSGAFADGLFEAGDAVSYEVTMASNGRPMAIVVHKV